MKKIEMIKGDLEVTVYEVEVPNYKDSGWKVKAEARKSGGKSSQSEKRKK